MKKRKALEDSLYTAGLLFAGRGLVLMILYLKFLVPFLPEGYCFFQRMFGIYCPGCGGTRAVVALLKGQFLRSLWYHPFVMYAVVMFGGFMLTNTLKRLSILPFKGWKFHNWYLWVALSIIIANWLVKNILLLCFHIPL